MISVTFQNLGEVRAWLASLPAAMRMALLSKSSDLAADLQENVQHKLSGEVLQSKNGRLRESIAGSVQETDNGVSVSVFSNGDVAYAAIQEYGGATKAHIIEAVHAKALVFAMYGKQMILKHVNHPGSVIPEHAYLRSSLEDMEGDIVDGMSSGMDVAINR